MFGTLIMRVPSVGIIFGLFRFIKDVDLGYVWFKCVMFVLFCFVFICLFCFVLVLFVCYLLRIIFTNELPLPDFTFLCAVVCV